MIGESSKNRTLTVINLTKKELKEKKQEDLIKQIIKNHLVLFGYEYFVEELI